jgi:hypothetical protein
MQRLTRILQASLFALLGSVEVKAHTGHSHELEIDPSQPIDYSEITIRDDINLYLVQPYENLIIGEGPNYYLGIKNSSKDDLLLNLGGDLDTGELWYSSGQMLVEARKETSDDNLTRPEWIPEWSKIEPALEPSKYGYIEIKSGETEILGSKVTPPGKLQFNYNVFPDGADEFRIGILVDSNEWVFTNWTHSLKRINTIHRKSGEVLANLKISQLEEHPVQKLNIEGTDYLFLLGTRVCILPEGVTPVIEQEGESLEAKLIVSFPNTDYEPVVHHANSMTTLSGPPELVPHLAAFNELKVRLEADVSANEQTDLPQSVDSSTPTSKPTAEKEQTEVVTTEPSSNWWLWLIGGVVVVGGLALVLRRKS